MSEDFGSEPVHIDAGYLCWCNRPRLYWTTWSLACGEGAKLVAGAELGSWELTGEQPLEKALEPGWTKVDPRHAFPTFTTSRPASRPGRKPAGIGQCDAAELGRWEADWHRFPPYQYMR